MLAKKAVVLLLFMNSSLSQHSMGAVRSFHKLVICRLTKALGSDIFCDTILVSVCVIKCYKVCKQTPCNVAAVGALAGLWMV